MYISIREHKYVGHLNRLTTCIQTSNNIMLSTSLDSSIKIWNITNNDCLFTFRGHTSSVYCCTIMRNKEHVYSAGNDGRILCWNLTTKKKGRLISKVMIVV
eukprot:UN28371